jgi:hypothetical protein
MKRFTLLIVLVGLGLLIASDSMADWLKSCITQGPNVTSLSGTGRIVCHRFDTVQDALQVDVSDDDPSVLQVTDCDQVDIFYYPDYDGDGTDNTGEIEVYTCPSSMFHEDTEATLLNACQPVNGAGITVLDETNTEVWGLGVGWLWFDVENWDDDAELQVKCNVGPE